MILAPHDVRFSRLTQIMRTRTLPVPGRVLVKVGDRVRTDDIVARTALQGDLRSVNLAQMLGVSIDAVPQCVQVTDGNVSKGQLLATVRHLLIKRHVYSPYSGTVQGISDGYLFIREHQEPFLLRAHLPGKVARVNGNQGITVRSAGAIVQGIWSSSGEHRGVLAMMAQHPHDLLTWDRVGLWYRATVIVGGILRDRRVLLRARQFQVHGLIVGSLDPSLKPLCRDLGLAVLVTEGMGHIPMAQPIFDLLRSHHGRLVVLSGDTRDGGDLPEAIIPIPSKIEGEAEAMIVAQPFQVGVNVRITRPPYLGQVALVVGIPQTPQQTTIGTRLEGADVRLIDGRRAFIPFVNMERLE